MKLTSLGAKSLPADFSDRVGTFFVPGDLIDKEPLAVMQFLNGMVILRAESLYQKKGIEYVARCAQFDPIPPFETAPHYSATIETDHQNSIIKVTWKRHGDSQQGE